MSFMMKTENGYIPISGNNGSSAGEISYNNTESELEAENVQEAIDEVNEDVTTLQTEMPNKADKTDLVGVNLLPYPYYSKNYTDLGLTWTIEDGNVSVKGTNTVAWSVGINFVFDPDGEYIFKLDKKKYIFHAKGENIPNNSMLIRVIPAKEDGTYNTITKNLENDYAEIIIDNTDGTYAYMRTIGLSVSNGKTVDVKNLHVQLEEGDTPHSYRPYTINNQLEDLRETKADKTEILPTYSLAEYEEIKNTIPVGTKFIITDDEGGDDPEPTPVSDSVVEWFVADTTHGINFEKLTVSTTIVTTGSFLYSVGGSVATICGSAFLSNFDRLDVYGIRYGSSFTPDAQQIPLNAPVSGVKHLLGFLKSDVEEYGIKQITF